MSPEAQKLEAHRQQKARALVAALAHARTPTEAVRFVMTHSKPTELQQLQRVAEAAQRAGL